MAQTRKPLVAYSPALIDVVHEDLREHGSGSSRESTPKQTVGSCARLADKYRDAPPEGEEGYRAAYILGVARGCLVGKLEPQQVAERFNGWVGPGSARTILKTLGVPEPRRRGRPPSVKTELTALFGRLGLPFLPHPRTASNRLTLPPLIRRTGRPPDGVVAVRVWTIDALRELSGLSRDRAIEVWNKNVTEAPYSGSLETMRRWFYLDRERVRERLLL